MYKIYKETNPSISEKYKADAIKGRKYLTQTSESNLLNLKETTLEANKYYQSVYRAFTQKDYQAVAQKIEKGKLLYADQYIMLKFELLGALTFAGMKQYTKYINALENIATRYLGYQEGKKAQELLDSAKKILLNNQ